MALTTVATVSTFWKSWDGAAHFANVAVEVFDATSNYAWEDGRHLFVMAANAVFIRLQDRDNWSEVDDPKAMKAFLKCLRSALEISLREGYENCGAYVQLPWFTSLAQLYRSALKTHPQDPYRGVAFSMEHTPLGRNGLLEDFTVVASLLKNGLVRGLFPGEQATKQYEDLAGLLGFASYAARPDPFQRSVPSSVSRSCPVDASARNAGLCSN